MFKDLISNKIAISCLLALVTSQVLKFIIYTIQKKKFNIDVLIHGYGGMPSTHTALAIALSYSIYLTEGLTNLFIFSLVFALITMNDVLDIRWFFKLRTKVLNEIIMIIKKKNVNINTVETFIGHTVIQVLAGIVLGVVIVHYVF